MGTVFYEMLFGKPPFVAANIIDLLRNIKSQPLEINRKLFYNLTYIYLNLKGEQYFERDRRRTKVDAGGRPDQTYLMERLI